MKRRTSKRSETLYLSLLLSGFSESADFFTANKGDYIIQIKSNHNHLIHIHKRKAKFRIYTVLQDHVEVSNSYKINPTSLKQIYKLISNGT